MTTSIRMRSGFSDFDLMIASSPFSAVTTWYPCLDRVSMKNCRSVGESSTIKIFFTAMAISSSTNGRVRPYGFQKTVLRKWLGQIFVRAHHSATRPIKQTVLGRQHNHGRSGEVRVFLDQRAGLIAIQARHHDVHEDDVWLMVGDLGESIETVFGEDDLATGLHQENLRAAANGVRIVDHHHFDAGKIRGFAHSVYPPQRPRSLTPTASSGFPKRSPDSASYRFLHYTTKSSQNKALCSVFQKRHQDHRVDLIATWAGWGGCSRECARTQISTISKSSFRAPHSGQVQFIGISSQRVPGGILSSGNPVASS